MTFSRKEILERLRESIAGGQPIVGAISGNGISAKFEEAEGVDLILLYNSGRFRVAGRSSLAGYMPYGDANAIVMEMGYEILPVVKHTPVLAGICGTDPFRLMDLFLAQVKEAGFSGVQNSPTVCLCDGSFRQNLEETGLGFALEVDMIRKAREMDLLTTPYVFDADEAAAMAEAGADIIVIHLGLATNGSTASDRDMSLKEVAKRVQKISDSVRGVNPNLIFLFHGGAVSTIEDAEYVLKRTSGIHGFYRVSSIEKLATKAINIGEVVSTE